MTDEDEKEIIRLKRTLNGVCDSRKYLHVVSALGLLLANVIAQSQTREQANYHTEAIVNLLRNTVEDEF
jgi:hypothetical protein